MKLQCAAHGPDHSLLPRHMVALPQDLHNKPTHSAVICLERDFGMQPGFIFVLLQRKCAG